MEQVEVVVLREMERKQEWEAEQERRQTTDSTTKPPDPKGERRSPNTIPSSHSR